ncbi:unnamed protein product [Thelazia callipaeda]|uniref:DUF4206 domain-containing protein n=1 Tax=Thelazia callipaeda TaxID=103827 RepID=A0A0N5D2L8_THECL|nr:unnamed protein product [Thelazia callipaeda]
MQDELCGNEFHKCQKRNEETLRVYAIAESFQTNYTAQMIIRDIRDKMMSFDSLGMNPRKDVSLEDVLKHLLSVTINAIQAKSTEELEKLEGRMPNVGIVSIYGSYLVGAFLRDIVFILVHKSLNAVPAVITIYSSNNEVLDVSKELKILDTVCYHTRQLRPGDARFFMFTAESIRALLIRSKSPDIYMKSPDMQIFVCEDHLQFFNICLKLRKLLSALDELTRTLHEWQKSIYPDNPYDTPTPGFLLVDHLQEIIGGQPTAFIASHQFGHEEQLSKEPWYWAYLLARRCGPIHCLNNKYGSLLEEFREQSRSFYIRIFRLKMQHRDLIQNYARRKDLIIKTIRMRNGKNVLDNLITTINYIWRISTEELYYIELSIETLISTIQYELCPALETLYQELFKLWTDGWIRQEVRRFKLLIDIYYQNIEAPSEKYVSSCEKRLAFIALTGYRIDMVLKSCF